MIRYALRCDREHRFDSWFGSSADFDRLKAGGLVACAVCGSASVEKELMAPSIGSAAGPGSGEVLPPEVLPPGGRPGPGPLSQPLSPAEQALAELRKRIEAAADNVGRDFAAEARRIHAGEAPERVIIGEARAAEAKALIEDGIPVAPLPWGNRKAN
jgi:hypothetical protein